MLSYQFNSTGTLKLLGSENYTDWAIRTKTNLQKLGLWGHIDGTVTEPLCLSANASAQDVKRAVHYNEQAQAARRYIISQISDGPYNTVIYKKGASRLPAKILWKTLRLRYQERGDKLRHELFQELMHTKWDGANPLEDHVEHFSRLMKRLNDITVADGLDAMPEWTQISLLLQSIDGINDHVQKMIVDVLKGADLRKRKFTEIVQDLVEHSHMKKMLEMIRTERVADRMMVGCVDATV
jgi:hypothetical protein